jgi:hypothetical protein
MRRLFLAAGILAALFAVASAQQFHSSQLADSGTPIVATSGTVAAATATATLAGAANKTTFICGAMVSGLGATAGSAVLGTISNLGATFSFNVGVPAGVTVPLAPHVLTFTACLPASGQNTAIAVSVPSFGSGNTAASVVAWGFQL